MRTQTLIAIAGLGVVSGLFLWTRATDTGTRDAATPPRYGHLILQVEGNARALSVTHVTPKASEYNPVRNGSQHSIDLLDIGGAVLGSYPLDLSMFDLAQERIGDGVRVEGCQVMDSRVATLTNVPWFDTLASIRIRKGQDVLGSLDASDFATLLAAGGNR